MKRGTRAEQLIETSYLQQLSDTYTEFFHYYDAAPLLIVNAAEIDLTGDANDYDLLVSYLINIKSGRHYYNPSPSIL